MVTFSVILMTIRQEPHFSWMADGLSRQTFKDFEWVVVDDKASVERYTEVLTLCAKYGIKLGFYGKSKASRWVGKRPALCNARNTGIVAANGNFIAFHDDNGWAQPTWLQEHLRHLQFGFLSAGTWFTTVDGHPENGKFVGDPGPYGWEERYKKFGQNGPIPFLWNDWLHGGNMAMPLEAILAVNGYDETYDGEQGVDDCDAAIRMRTLGYKGVFNPNCQVYYSIKTHTLTQKSIDAVKAGWTEEKIVREPKKKWLKRDTKEPHFANEFLIQELMEGKRPTRANTNFDMVQLREQYRKTLKFDHPLGLEKDWRDEELISEMT